MNVENFLTLIARLAPFDLARDWDNSGLQIGRLSARVRKVGLCLDVTLATVAEAEALGCDLLIAHHPLLFQPWRAIDLDTPAGRLAARIFASGLNVIAAHTNWDAAEGGVALALAEILNLEALRPLEEVERDFYKLVVFVPPDHEEKVREALFAAGAGAVGEYGRCYFSGPGQGGFRAPIGARPFIGREGRDEKISENRLEVILPKNRAGRAARAVRDAHPYEEPAYEFHSVRLNNPAQGLGLMGQWDPPRDFLPHCQAALGLAGLKWAGPEPGLVSRVALLPGAGGSFVGTAFRAGAQVLITGDVDYHEALEAEALGLTVVDVGHFETEWPGALKLKLRLEEELIRAGRDIPCLMLSQRPVWNYRPFVGPDVLLG